MTTVQDAQQQARHQARLKISEPHVIEQITRITQDRTMTPSAIKIYIALINLTRNGYDETKREHIAELTGLKGRTITKALTDLRDAGYIKSKQTQRSQKYVVLK